MEKALQRENMKTEEKGFLMNKEQKKDKGNVNLLLYHRNLATLQIKNCAANRIKKVLPHSPGKKREIIKSLSKEFNIFKDNKIILKSPIVNLDWTN